MNTSLVRAFVAAASLAPFYLVFDGKARADDWGCQVILCLSNPGGPTQYAECRPPIEKLWRVLAKGHGDRGREASCISTTPQIVSSHECYFDNDRSTSPRWQRSEGRIKCQRYVTTRPNIRPQPHYVDVTIDGGGKQRVWY